MFPQTFFTAQGEPHTMNYASPEGAPVPFPPDVQTPVSDQLDDITYPGSEVTVINRTPDQPSGYWPKSGCFVPPNSGYHSMHPASPHTFTVAQSGQSYPFENESSSTLSCADGYQVQNQEETMGGSASFMCPSGQHTADAETLRDGAATMCDCNSDILLDGRGSLTSLDKNTPSSPTSVRKHHHRHQQQQDQQQHHHQRKKHTSGRSSRSKRRRAGGEGAEAEEEGEDECSFFRRSGRRSHKASSGGLSHCLSEDDSLSRRQKRSSWGTRRSEYLRRSGKSRSPAERSNQCSDCAAACGTNRSWNSMASRHANSLPTLKKRQQNSPPCEFSERPLRNRKPVNGLFGFNLAAARAEEQWSDTEAASVPARNGQMYKTVDSGCCGIICLSFICIVGVSCLFSPIGMLILPVVLSFTSQSKKTPASEDFVSSSSALSLTDSDFLGSQDKLNSAGITCNTRCEADLLSLGVKLIILCLTTWKLYVLPVVLVYRRLGIRPLSVSAILNRKLRAGCYKTKSKPVNPSSLHPYPIERPFAVTISVNFLSFGATCAFWVVFVARWVNSSGSAQRPTPLPDPTDLFGLDDVSSSPSSQTASLLAYSNLVSFVLTFADTQLVLHILGLILEGLQRVLTDKTVYVVQVVRSPDGHSKSYRVNGGSIDSVATELLHRYLVDFPLYDAQAASAPYRYTRLSSEPARGPSRSCGGSRKQSLSGLTPSEQEYQIKRCSSTGSSFKFYSLDGPGSETNDQSAGGGDGGGGDGVSFENFTGSEPDQGYNVNALCADRYHSEVDFEFAHQKRWMRLLIATERAFAAIEAVLPTGVRMADCPNLVTPRQAAQMIFPKVIVPLQKYLRLTRLQHLHPPDNVLSRLSTFIAHSCSPAAFLEAYSLGQPFTTITAAFASSGLPSRRRPFGGGCSGEVHRPACCQSQLHRPTSCSAAGVSCWSSSGFEDVHLLQSWCLTSETLPLSRPLQPGTRFRLSRAGVTLFCTVHAKTAFQLKRSSSNLPSFVPQVHTSHRNFPQTSAGAAEVCAVDSVHTKSPTPGRPTV